MFQEDLYRKTMFQEISGKPLNNKLYHELCGR